MPSSTDVITTVVDTDPSTYEAKHVHEIYDRIASHFSSTRYKPWPIIANFLCNIPTGWVGLDSGTGNGKYLPLPLDRPGSIWTIGLDRSRNLLDSARIAGNNGTIREVIWGDVLGNGWRRGAFDYAISIATIHHLATSSRRKSAIQRLLECVSSQHGRILVYVWAIEQDKLSKRAIPTHQSRDPTDTMARGQDVFVPWMLTDSKPQYKADKGTSGKSETQPGTASQQVEEGAFEKPKQARYDRYYHMFAEGELLDLACEAAREMGLKVGPRSLEFDNNPKANVQGAEVMQSGWERSNYYVEMRRWET